VKHSSSLEYVERINTRHYLNRGILPEDIPSFPSGRIQWEQQQRAQYYAELAQDRAAQDQGTTCPICRRFQVVPPMFEDLLLAQPHNLWVINADSQ
jgi:hypothetical protein